MPKVLVIDDEPNIRFSIEQVLDQEGLRVMGAQTAEEGLRLAAEELPDVILLDIRLGQAVRAWRSSANCVRWTPSAW